MKRAWIVENFRGERMKIFITGLTGFVGQSLAHFLDPLDEIYALCPPGEILSGGVRVVDGDLNDPKSFAGRLEEIRPDVCIHLAWEGIPDYSFEMSRRNLDQGIALFRLLVEKCGCRKIIAMGSCWEYGQSLGACREDVSAPVHSYFAWAKRSLCDFGMTLAALKQISFIWLRAFYLYGPRQKETSLIPAISTTLLRGEAPEIRMPQNAHDFIYVDDAAKAMAAVVRKEAPSGVYNLGTGQATYVWKICEGIEKALGQKPIHAKALQDRDVKTAENFWADTKKTETFLGWCATTGIEEGIKKYIETLEAKE